MAKPIKSNDPAFNDKRTTSPHLTALLCEPFFLTHKWGCKRYWSSALRRGKVPGKNASVLSERSYLQLAGHGRKVWCNIALCQKWIWPKSFTLCSAHWEHWARSFTEYSLLELTNLTIESESLCIEINNSTFESCCSLSAETNQNKTAGTKLMTK